MRIKENSVAYKIGKILLKIAVGLVTILLVWHAFGTMLPGLLPLLRHGDQKEIAAYLEQAGHWKGMLCTFMLAILQVVSVIIPGAAIQIAAGAIYGWWRGFIMCFFGYWLANVGVFYFARRVRNHKLENHSMNPVTVKLMELMNSANPGFVVAVACLMPGIPNGIIPYIAAKSAVTGREFARAVAIGCWMPILCICIVGRYLLQGEFGICVALIVFQLCLIGLIVWKRRWILEMLEKAKEKKRQRKAK